MTATELPLYSFDQYLQRVTRTASQFTDWRPGQTAFNVLSEVRPDLAMKVWAKVGLDPFHNTEVLPAFYRFIEEHWADEH